MFEDRIGTPSKVLVLGKDSAPPSQPQIIQAPREKSSILYITLWR